MNDQCLIISSMYEELMNDNVLMIIGQKEMKINIHR